MRTLSRFLLVVLGLFVLTGCSNKKLVCQKENIDDSDIKMMETIICNFDKNDIVTDMKMKVVVNLPDSYKGKVNVFKSYLKNAYQKYIDNGASVNIESHDMLLIVKINLIVSKLNDEQKRELQIDNLETFENTFKSFESKGFSCN